MFMQACPPRDQLDAFQAGSLDEDGLTAVAAHVDTCSTCQRTLETVVGDSADSVLAALLNDAQPGSFAAEPACRQAVERAAALAGDSTSIPDRTEATVAVAAAPAIASPSEMLPVASIREYKLLAKLGEGGMGAVYKALHTRLDKVVALKILPADRMRDAGAVARFQREMKAVGRLDHPNIVRAMDAGEEGGMHFLVMEYVEGIDLSQLAKNIGPLPIADACELIRQAALGLAEAHEHGMVHRDIKPSNLILAAPKKKKRQPTVKILDLGLALLSEALAPDHQGLTTSGQMMGTIDYMAPEQGGDSHQVDIRADIYSLGATLYKLLTGSAPFAGDKFDTPVKKLTALATQSPASVTARRPDVPAPLAAIVERMLAKDPAARFSTPEELVEALAPYCQSADLDSLSRRAHAALPGVDAGAKLAGDRAPGAEQGTHARSSPSGDTAPTIDRAALPLSRRDHAAQPGVDAGAKHAAAPAASKPRPLVAALAGRYARRNLAIALACGSAALAVLLGVIFYIQTQRGTIQIEINDPSIRVVLDNDGNATFQGVDKKHEIKVKPGEHGLTITRGDLTFNTDKFVLKKGETVTLLVQYLPGTVEVVQKGGKSLGSGAVVEPDYALEFDGKSDWVRIPTLNPRLDSPITMEGFFTPRSVPEPADEPRILIWNQYPNQAYLQVYVGVWSFVVQEGTKDAFRETRAIKAVPGRRVHAASVWNGHELFLFIDGTPQKIAPTTWEVPANVGKWQGEMALGRGKTEDQFYDGVMDEIRVSDVARYEGQFVPPVRLESDDHTLALYHCDEGSGTELKDSSGHNHHGKIVGAKWVKAEAPRQQFALEFDSDGQYVEVPGFPYDPAGPLTFEAIVQADELRLAPLVALRGSGRNFSLFRGGDSASSYGFAVQHPQEKDDLFANVPQKAGWRHVCGVWDGKSSALYVDGKKVGTLHKSGQVYKGKGNSPHLVIGGEIGLPRSLRGRIRAVRISKAARYTSDFEPPQSFQRDQQTTALYDFTDGPGEVLKDSSGNDHHGKIVGAKWVRETSPVRETPVDVNLALQFDGIDDFAATTAVCPAQGPVTVEAWIRADADANVGHEIINANDPDGGFGFMLLSPAHAGLKQNAEPVWAGVPAKESIPREEWVHMAAVFDGQTLEFFVNGVSQGERQVDRPLRPKTPFAIGRDSTVDRHHFAGLIDEVRISTTARYIDDFSPRRQFEPDADTLALYHFDDGQGDLLTDASGNEHHGKIVGAKWVRMDGIPPALPGPYALEFNGTTDYAEIPIKPELLGKFVPGKPFTYEAFVTAYPQRPEARDASTRTPSLTPAVIGHLQIGGITYIPGHPLSAGPSGHRVFSDAPLQEGTEAHLALVWDGAEMRLYVDGRRQRAGVKTLPPDNSSNTQQFDRAWFSVCGMWSQPAATNHFAGRIRELRISTTARYTDDFIPRPRHSPDPDTLGLYHIEEGQGKVLNDSSGNDHHGKIFGAKWVRAERAPLTSSTPAHPLASRGLQFNGTTSDYVLFPDLVAPAGTNNPITLEGWFTLATEKDVSLFTLPCADGEGLYRLTVADAGPQAVRVAKKKDAIAYSRSGTLTSGKLFHLAAGYNGNSWTLWLNGKKLGEKSDRYGWNPPITQVFGAVAGSDTGIGIPSSSGQSRRPFQGTMHGLRISRVVRYTADFQPAERFDVDADTLALYHCDEGQGDVLTDSSGNKHHGKIVGAKWVKWVKADSDPSSPEQLPPYVSPSKHALVFDGKSNYVDLPLVKLDDVQEFTLEMDLKPTKAQVTDLLTNGAVGFIWDAKKGPPQLRFGIMTEDKEFPIVDAAVGGFPPEVMHLAGVLDQDELRIYVNGKQAGRKLLRGKKIARPLTALTLGTNEWLALNKPGSTSDTDSYLNFFEGTIQRLRISNVARYQQDFTPGARFEPDQDTIALYQFDEGQGDVLTDSSGNNHHGKIVGAKWVKAESVVPLGAPSAAEETIDLLKLVDVERDAAHGKWTRSAEGLLSDGSVPFCRLKLPYAPPAEYDFRVEFTAQGGNDILQLFTIGGRSCTWLMGAWGGKHDGFDTVRDHPLTREGTNIIGGPTSIRRGQRHTSVIQVRRDSITAKIDGKQVVRHMTDGSDLGIPAEWSIGEGAIGLGTTFDAVVFHKVELVVPGSSGGSPDEASVRPGSTGAQQALEKQEPFTNSLGMKFVLIPKGESWLGGGGGTPGEKHVEFPEEFFLGAFEVTQAQWLAVTGLNPSQFRGVERLSDEEALRLPVEKVSWDDAQLFLERLNARDKQPGWVYRLPTEAQWEYACRGGSLSDMLACGFHYYLEKPANEPPPGQINYSYPGAINRTNLVGSYPPNPLGLFDMHGNVWEWCQDEAPADPADETPGPHRAMRGGSWNSSAESCQAAHSYGRPASFRGMHVGLRIARLRTGGDTP